MSCGARRLLVIHGLIDEVANTALIVPDLQDDGGFPVVDVDSPVVGVSLIVDFVDCDIDNDGHGVIAGFVLRRWDKEGQPKWR